MRPRLLLLAVSLIANLALLAAVADRSGQWRGLFWPASATAENPAPGGAPAVAPAAPATDPHWWSEASSGDLATIAVRLQAEGFPRSVQRAILTSLIAAQFADRHRALAVMIDAAPWWRGNVFGTKEGAKILAARQQLAREEKEALDRLLGADSGATSYARADRARRYGELSAEKLSELARIDADYTEMISEIRSAAQGILLPEDREQLVLLEKERRADIARVLSPDELLAYDLRSSPTAESLRRQLIAFGPTEEEFRALFKVQQAFDAQFGGGSFEMMTPEQRRARSMALDELKKQVQPVLTPERFAEYEQKTDPAYLQANAIVTRLQLPAEATGEIVAVRQDIMKRANQVRSDRTLGVDERNARLVALADEATLRLSPTLGSAGLEAYKQSGGQWISALKRPPGSGPGTSPSPKP